MGAIGWIIINVLLPIFAPLAVLPFFRLFEHALPERARRVLRWTTPLKDGQLAWVALAFNAATAYELFNSEASKTVIGGGLLGLAGVGIANVLIAALGGVFPVEGEPPVGKSPWRHYPAIKVSVGLTAASAIAFIAVHFLA